MANEQKVHQFERNVAADELPQRFTYPFCYTPHPLCIEAAELVKRHLAGCHSLLPELNEGKMLGVMVVQDTAERSADLRDIIARLKKGDRLYIGAILGYHN